MSRQSSDVSEACLYDVLANPYSQRWRLLDSLADLSPEGWRGRSCYDLGIFWSRVRRSRYSLRSATTRSFSLTMVAASIPGCLSWD